MDHLRSLLEKKEDLVAFVHEAEAYEGSISYIHATTVSRGDTAGLSAALCGAYLLLDDPHVAKAAVERLLLLETISSDHPDQGAADVKAARAAAALLLPICHHSMNGDYETAFMMAQRAAAGEGGLVAVVGQLEGGGAWGPPLTQMLENVLNHLVVVFTELTRAVYAENVFGTKDVMAQLGLSAAAYEQRLAAGTALRAQVLSSLAAAEAAVRRTDRPDEVVKYVHEALAV